MRFIAVLFFVLGILTAGAQPVIPRFETLGVNDGLSQSSIYSIFQDHAGYMWFGTADGLNRYDGNTVRAYRLHDDLSAPANSNHVRGQLSEDGQGNIWYANETGIYCYERSSENLRCAMRFNFGEYGGVIFMALGISEGGLWLVNFRDGAARFDLRSHRLQSFPFPASYNATKRDNSNGVIADNHIFFSIYEHSGFIDFDMRKKRYRFAMPALDIRRICPGRGKTFLIAPEGIYILDSTTQKTRLLECRADNTTLHNISNVLEDALGRLWIMTVGQGLVLYDPRAGRFFNYHHDNTKLRSLSIDLLTEALIDRGQNLWVGTDGGGVCRLDLKPPRFNLFPRNEGDYPFLKDYFTKCFYEDRHGRVWFGTHSNGFNIFDPLSGDVRNYSHDASNPASLPGNIVGAIMEDRKGRTWIGHNFGISIFDEKKGRFETMRPAPWVPVTAHNIYVNGLCELRNGNIVAATAVGLAQVIQTRAGPKLRNYYSGPLNSQTTAVVEPEADEIWYSCPYIGLFQARVSGDSFVLVKKLLPAMELRCLHVDEADAGILWVGSSKGLIRLERKTGRHQLFDNSAGLANCYVYGILEDERHNLWVSTNGGLSYFDRQKNSFTNFTNADGLQSNEFNTNAFHRGRSGTFYFGGVRGFNWFSSESFRHDQLRYEPQVAITTVWVNDKILQADSSKSGPGGMELDYKSNNLAFEFAALDFTRPAANKLLYRLESWDKSWIVTNNRTVRYGNLPSGTYRLRVRALNPDGLQSPVAAMSFVIAAPFWKRLWFYIVLASALLTVVILLTRSVAQRNIRQRLRVLEQERTLEAERNRISRDMHDEIGSGLTQIALLSELIQAQQKAEAELKKDVATISAQARRLVKNIGEIIWALHPQNISVAHLFAYIREQAQEYFEPFDVELEIDFPNDLPSSALSNEQRRNLFLSVKEALHNALKHAQATRVTLTGNFNPDGIRFAVSDNGTGIRGITRPGANGLRNMEKRMVDIGGEFSIQSSSAGTHVSFVLPLTDGRNKRIVTGAGKKKMPDAG